jgi:hypothetical protein
VALPSRVLSLPLSFITPVVLPCIASLARSAVELHWKRTSTHVFDAYNREHSNITRSCWQVRRAAYRHLLSLIAGARSRVWITNAYSPSILLPLEPTQYMFYAVAHSLSFPPLLCLFFVSSSCLLIAATSYLKALSFALLLKPQDEE